MVGHSVFLRFDGDVAVRFDGDVADGDVATRLSRTVLAFEPANVQMNFGRMNLGGPWL